MGADLSYGPRLTDEEYQRKIVALRSDLPPEPTPAQETQVRRQELDLAIQHRLGRDFPRQRSDALWEIQQRVEKKRRRLIWKYLLKGLFGRTVAGEAQGLAGELVGEYAKVLSPAELERFFGAEEVRHPALPIDTDRVKT